MSTLKHKRIILTFRLGQGKNFGEDGFDTVKLSGQLRVSAQINTLNGPSQANLDLRVFGMTLSSMSKLMTLGPVKNPYEVRNNEVDVEVGNVDDIPSLVFSGTIQNAYIDFSGMPEVNFYVQALIGTILALRPATATSFNGLADVATIMSGLATQGRRIFQNNGVDAKVMDPYYPGTIWDQMEACAKHANINWVHDEKSLTVAIWPRNGVRGGLIPVLSPSSGLIGYPSFTRLGIDGTCVFNPSLLVGGIFKIESSLQGANGEWQVQAVSHHLESETPGGQWTSRFVGVPPGYFAIST